jgi:hypothetical protein
VSPSAGVKHNGGDIDTGRSDGDEHRVGRRSARFGLGVKHKDAELAVINAHRVVVLAVDANRHTFR